MPEYVNIPSVVHILLFISSFFFQRLEILETDKTLQNDLTDKDILPLADKDHLLLYTIVNVSYTSLNRSTFKFVRSL